MSAPFNLNKSTLGQREKDTPGTFRESQGMPYLDSSPSNFNEGGDGGDDKKKQESKAPKLSVDTPSGPKAPRGPQSGNVLGIPVSIQTKGRSTQNTDLLEEGKKIYNKVKNYFSN
jgi:hypothetical protein